MTTPVDPLDGFIMPFGVVAVSGAPSNVLTPGYIRLAAGVHTVQIVWSQPSRLRVTLADLASQSSRVDIGSVPSGSDRRSAVIFGIGVPSGAVRYLSLIADTVPPLSAVATIQVISTPLQE